MRIQDRIIENGLTEEGSEENAYGLDYSDGAAQGINNVQFLTTH